MSTLAGLQRAFARAVEEGGDALALRIRGAGSTPAARIAFYRASVRSQRHGALAATYAVVRRLVGDDFFREMARRYAAAHPSRSGDLRLFGDRFGDFLEQDRDARALACLGDVARLEWARHESFHAAEAPGLDAAALAAVAPERQGEVRLLLHPSVRL
ncbi:MAG TPA: DNA-binding domain-containing protein, partial [Usitatibacter sp.]|nr:DNA-binding domain-containing protein [Usitatibacter sp.]